VETVAGWLKTMAFFPMNGEEYYTYYTLISLNKNEGNGRTPLQSENPSLLSTQAQNLKWPPQLSTGKKYLQVSSSIFQPLFFILFQVCDVILGAILAWPCFARQVMTAQHGGRS
jgi:hypothetical protein